MVTLHPPSTHLMSLALSHLFLSDGPRGITHICVFSTADCTLVKTQKAIAINHWHQASEEQLGVERVLA